jgi:hypothetical protein
VHELDYIDFADGGAVDRLVMPGGYVLDGS